MIKIYDKSGNIVFAFEGPLPILTHDEFKCKCNNYRCQYTIISTVLIARFKKLRILAGNKPIKITSGFRCSTHNLAEGGKKLSRHLFGFALDMIPPKGVTLNNFEKMAKAAGFTYTKKYPEFNVLHSDVHNQD